MSWEEDGAVQQTKWLLSLKEKSERLGDRAWQQYRAFTGDVDYSEADHGEPPKGAEW